MKARDFRALARQALSGRWGVAVLTGFLAALLGGTMASSGGSGSGGSSVGSSAGEFIQSSGGHYEIPDFVWTALIIFGTLLSIYALVCFIIGGTVQLGYAKFNLALIDHKDAQVSDLFSQFHRFGDGFLLSLLTAIFVTLWTPSLASSRATATPWRPIFSMNIPVFARWTRSKPPKSSCAAINGGCFVWN